MRIDPSDEIPTPTRVQIQGLYHELGVVPAPIGFRCSNLESCSEGGARDLITGNWAFVGAEYGRAPVGSRSARILFIAMDRGGGGRADEESFAETQASFRSSIEAPSNPHMGGVALILARLLGVEDRERLARWCALTNAIKCARRTGSQSTSPTATMIRQCRSHLLFETGLLRPHLIVTQGDHPRATLRQLLPGPEAVGTWRGRVKGTAAVRIVPSAVILETPHPARQPDFKWSRGQVPLFLEKAIALARKMLSERLADAAAQATPPPVRRR